MMYLCKKNYKKERECLFKLKILKYIDNGFNAIINKK